MMNASLIDSMVNDGLWDVFNNYHMGITAENIAEQWKIDRQEMDAFAYESQLKAKKAQEDGRFDQEIISIPVFRKKERISFNKDESLRLSDVEALSKLKPAFKQGGKVTAGNSSGISDGAATIILASREAVEKYHLEPIAKLIGWGFAGVQPDIMGIAPVEAVRRAVNKANTRLEEIDLFELNEAFAVQSLAVIKELSLEKSIVNVNGGAIALGHPIGASGVRIIVTLIHEMLKRKNAKKGLASLCIGGGMGLASIFEKI